MTIDLSKLTMSELQKLSAEIQTELPKRKAAELESVRLRIAEMARKHGFEMAEILGRKMKRATLAPKYRNPKTGQTWSGRGRTPRWMPKDRKSVEIRAA